MAGADLSLIYEAPNPPASTGDAVADVEVAWNWLAAFLWERAPTMVIDTELIQSRIARAL